MPRCLSAACLPLAALLALAACGEAAEAPGGEPADGVVAEEPAAPTPDLGRGLLVWESLRDGQWGIWARDLDGSPPRRLTPLEPDRPHCCPHLAPDGRRLVYLSLEPGQAPYPEAGGIGELRLLELDAPGGPAGRVLAPVARSYYENRAAVWLSDDELIHVDGEGIPVRRKLDAAAAERLIDSAPEAQPFLVGPSLEWAATGLNGFFRYDRERRAIVPRTPFGGCQFYFSHDGRFGIWTAGTGGPINRVELASGEITTLLRKNDPRLEQPYGYLYFPMPSRDGTLLAFAASPNEHDHFAANYEIFLVETDPATLAPVGPVSRWTRHPGSDRFPDVWREPGSGPPRPAAAPTPPAKTEPAADTAAYDWPSDREGLLFVWATGDAPNLVPDPALGLERAVVLEARGAARLDRDFAMRLGGGWFEAAPEDAERVLAGLQRTHELTLELTVEPAPWRRPAPGVLVSQGLAGGAKNFILSEGAAGAIFKMRGSGGERAGQQKLAPLVAGEKTHLVLTYSPGRLALYRNGEPALDSRAIQSDTFTWRSFPLTFGAEVGGGLDWAGTLEGIAIYDRALSAAEARANAERYRARLTERPEVPLRRAEARLEACSPPPTLDEIAPYRAALTACRWRVERWLEGAPAGSTVRVAEWALLDGREVGPPAPGTRAVLSLEPHAAQPQLEPVPLADRLGDGGELFYRVD